MSGFQHFFSIPIVVLLANLGTFFVNENFNAEVASVPGVWNPGQMGYYFRAGTL